MRESDSDQIYLIHAEETEYYKIGVSYQVNNRLYDLQRANPHQLRLVKVVVGSMLEEKRLFRKFQSCRVRGEWFRFTARQVPEVCEAMDLPEKEKLQKKLEQSNKMIEAQKEIQKACEWLAEQLEGGPKRPWKVQRAARSAGIDLDRLRTAKDRLRVEVRTPSGVIWDL
jgi:hypothetical protein